LGNITTLNAIMKGGKPKTNSIKRTMDRKMKGLSQIFIEG